MIKIFASLLLGIGIGIDISFFEFIYSVSLAYNVFTKN